VRQHPHRSAAEQIGPSAQPAPANSLSRNIFRVTPCGSIFCPDQPQSATPNYNGIIDLETSPKKWRGPTRHCRSCWRSLVIACCTLFVHQKKRRMRSSVVETNNNEAAPGSEVRSPKPDARASHARRHHLPGSANRRFLLLELSPVAHMSPARHLDQRLPYGVNQVVLDQ
jgi:hypothetical protein